MKTAKHLLVGVLAGIAYIDMVAACFATALGLRDLALLLVGSAMLLVIGAFCFAREARNG